MTKIRILPTGHYLVSRGLWFQFYKDMEDALLAFTLLQWTKKPRRTYDIW